jgi:Lon protease-like protein
VLFPGGRLPLRIFEARYMDMAKACLKDGSPFGVCLIREGREVGAPALPAPVGTTATIAQWDMPQLGVLEIVALGGERFRILERRVEPNGLARAEVELLAPEADAQAPGSLAFCARLAERLPLPSGVLQELLEMDDAAARFARVNALLKALREAP